jgi:hypothetical protein
LKKFQKSNLKTQLFTGIAALPDAVGTQNDCGAGINILPLEFPKPGMPLNSERNAVTVQLFKLVSSRIIKYCGLIPGTNPVKCSPGRIKCQEKYRFCV